MRWVITAGGTGGHLIPGLVIVEALCKEGEEVLFISGKRPIEREILKDKPFRIEQIDVEGLVGRPLFSKIKALFKLFLATIKVYQLFKKYRPDLVLAEGGYVSVPAVIAAKLLGVKSGLHEQNLIPGRANRLLSKLVDCIFISFQESAIYFPSEKTILTGNPVRKELLEPKVREHSGLGLLVLGGSLGAQFLNDLMLEIIDTLIKEVPNLYLIHQTGHSDYQRIKELYEKKSFWEDLKERIQIFPFIKDMGWAYAQADLVIARAGASTLSELIALKKPTILIPFPYATDRHQEKNAEVLAKIGGALVFKQEEIKDWKAFGKKVVTLLKDRRILEEMKDSYNKISLPSAEERIIKEMMRLKGGRVFDVG